ncbi:MAG: thioredoxin family protein [Flavobacteriales bacterium]|nr:thioredoxin family protein [Flavobacteriales bacterium]
MEEVIAKALTSAFSYRDYRNLIEELLSKNQTTGPNQSEDYIHYTLMNDVRMKRLEKTTRILLEYQKIMAREAEDQIWLIITEAWCGDAAQVIPVIEKLADLNPAIETRYVLRDEHLDLMDKFLTNGGRSIPKIIVLDKKTGHVQMSWGPRPIEAQGMVNARIIEESPEPYAEFSIKLQRWYAKDKTLSIQDEFMKSYSESISA